MPKSMVGTPLELTLYGPDDEVIKRYTKLIVPWKIMKRAIQLVKTMNVERPEDLQDEDMDKISALVVEAFGGQFGIEDLDNGADIGDMLAVLGQIVNKAQGLVPNPPPTAT
jgi:hypothetical protein